MNSVKRICALVTGVPLVLLAGAATAAGPSGTTWQAMLRANPAVVQDSTIGPLEREVLQVLTPEQVKAWMDGADPATLRLADGTDLASFLALKLGSSGGLVFHPVTACWVLNTTAAGGALVAPESRDFNVTPETGDFSSQGGSSTGCGVPSGVPAVLLNLKGVGVSGDGQVLVYDQGGIPSTPLVNFGSVAPKDNNAVTVPLCTGGACTADLTAEIPIAVGSSANLKIAVLGYFSNDGSDLTGVTAADLSCTDCVDGSEILDGSLTSTHLASNSVGSSEIQTGAVASSEVLDGSLTAADLASDSVGSSEIQTGAVASSEVLDNSLTAADLASSSVGSSEIQIGAVGSSQVNSSQVQLRVLGSCSPGQSIRVISSGGNVTCEIDTDTHVTSLGGLSGGTITSSVTVSGNIQTPSGSITTGVPSIGAGALDIVSTDDLGADDLIQSLGGNIEAVNGRITAFSGGSATFPGDGDGDAGDVNAADDLRAGDDVLALGTKSAVVKTALFGSRRFYADESTEVYFFDRGRSRLSNGEAFIPLDPIFASSISVSDSDPLLVQITLTASCNGVFVERADASGFVVRELGNGTSDATFNWEVAGKRRAYERTRLEQIDILTFKSAHDLAESK